MTHIIVVGTSEPQDFLLANDGAAINLTSMAVTLEIAERVAGVWTELDPAPTVALLSAGDGTVRVSGVEALTPNVYRVRFKIVDVGGDIGFAPNGGRADLWQVVPVFAP